MLYILVFWLYVYELVQRLCIGSVFTKCLLVSCGLFKFEELAA